jgi:hypothetical protein
MADGRIEKENLLPVISGLRIVARSYGYSLLGKAAGARFVRAVSDLAAVAKLQDEYERDGEQMVGWPIGDVAIEAAVDPSHSGRHQ